VRRDRDGTRGDLSSVGPVCDVCGVRVGIYEPAVWDSPDGPVHGSLLTLAKSPDFDAGRARLVHRDCAIREDER
jgi:hypothetical protein